MFLACPHPHFLVSSMTVAVTSVVISDIPVAGGAQHGGAVEPIPGRRAQGAHSPPGTEAGEQETLAWCQGPGDTQQTALLVCVGWVRGGFLEKVTLKPVPRGRVARAGEQRGKACAAEPRGRWAGQDGEGGSCRTPECRVVAQGATPLQGPCALPKHCQSPA